MKYLIATFITIFSAQSFAAVKSVDVVYGEDNRKDVFESTNSSFVELSKSTAAMISLDNLKTLKGEVKISSLTLEGRGVCSQERFAKQVAASNCSGFLVGEKTLVTAGHCMRTMADCDSYKWVFDYKVDHAEQGSVSVSSKDVYSCKKIISSAYNEYTLQDYAVIELDRKTDRKPLAFRRKGKIRKGASLVVIGHPTGLPTKIADGAKVRSLNTLFFVANLDTFGGSSGSAVFNTKTSEVEGILVRGENDYVYNPAAGCRMVNHCENDSCRGEDVTYITNIDAIKDLP